MLPACWPRRGNPCQLLFRHRPCSSSAVQGGGTCEAVAPLLASRCAACCCREGAGHFGRSSREGPPNRAGVPTPRCLLLRCLLLLLAAAAEKAQAISVQGGGTYEQEFSLEMEKAKQGKVKNTPWGSTFREVGAPAAAAAATRISHPGALGVGAVSHPKSGCRPGWGSSS